MKISVIGAGNGGQTMAGHFSLLGHSVILYNRNLEELEDLASHKTIQLQGVISGVAKLYDITDDIRKAVAHSELLMVTTTADAHTNIAKAIAPYVRSSQIVVLNPGRTFGAFVFSKVIMEETSQRPIVAEAQSLLYACRASKQGHVNILGLKKNVPVAALPAKHTDKVLEVLNSITQGFIKANSILETSLENIGAILHPGIVIANAATIERGESFYFYRDMTSAVSNILQNLDTERIKIAESFGVTVKPVIDWISFAYKNNEGETLHEKMRLNPAYYNILSPAELNNRYLTEDIPTGLIPMSELAQIVKVPTPYMNSIITLSMGLLGMDFYKNGRTLKNLGLEQTNIESLKQLL
jgi:opine dehydrogenase